LGGVPGERRLLDFFADEGVAEVLWPALADDLRFRAERFVDRWFGPNMPHSRAP